MLGAAPTCKLYRGVPFLLAIVAGGLATLLISSANAQAEVQQARAHVAPVWGVALDGRQADQPSLELLAQAKAAGVNAIVTDPKRWSTERHRRLVSLARGLGMFLIEPRRPSNDDGSATELGARCTSGRRVHRPCAFVAKSPREAVELARRGTVDYVVVRLGSPADLALVNSKRSTRTQLITVLTVGESANLGASWDQAIDSAVQSPKTTLATGLSGAFAATAIRDYFQLLNKHDAGAATFDQSQDNRGKSSKRDRLPPTAPLAATVASASSTSVFLKWTASTDNVGVAGYGIYLGGTSIGSTAATTFTVTGLQCGSIYTFAIDAYDKSRNRSQKVAVTGATSSCPLPPPSSPPSQPPSPPSAPPDRSDRSRPSRLDGLAASGVTRSSVTLTWKPSTDNVGVAGYEIFNGSRSVGTTASTSYLLTGLSCGTTYQLAVRAYDAAGNNSKPATIRAATTACSTPSGDTQAPTTPGNVRLISTTVGSITLAWGASNDNVGVTGYGVYRDGNLAGSTNSTSYTVAGLACGTNYALAVDAYDAAGNHSQRALITTSTSSCPPALDTQPPTVPTNVRATGATPTSVTIAWASSTDNVGVTGYTVYNGAAATGNATSTSYAVVGLSCGATYTLAVDAYDAAGNRSAKASTTASTSACPPAADTQAPTVPGGLRVTGATASSVTVAWTASTDNVGVSGYGVYNGSASMGTTASTSYTVSGLSCATGYTIAVDAYDAAGNRSSKASISVTTSACAPPPPAPDTQVPTVPGGLHVTGATATSITVAWTASTDNVGVAGYGLYRGATSTGTTPSTSATFSGLSCGTGYTLAVDAYDAAGNRSTKASISSPTGSCPPPPPTSDTQAPTVPGGLRATGATASSVIVAWTASTDNVGVAGYGLYRGGTSTGTTTLMSATFSGLSCGTGYTLEVDAYDAAGNHSAKASVTASTSACPPAADTQAPTVPGGLRVTAATANSVTLAWTASADNVAVAGYGVYNASASVGNTASTSYTVSGLSCGTGYTLAVDAFDAAGNRSSKASVSTTTSACAPPPPAADTQAPTVPGGLHVTAATGTSITVAWNASTDNVGVAGYGLYRSGTSTGTTASTSATFSGLSCGTGYTLSVDAYDAAGNRSAQGTISAPTSACPPPPPAPDTQLPTVPGGLRATSATASSITVAWTASADNVGVTGYGLYRNGASTGTTVAVTATFSGLSCGTGYTVAVDAYDAAGNRSAKASITASTSACPPAADTQPPTVPGGLRVTAATANSITLAWTASTDNVGVTGYGVYNGSAAVGSTASTSYTVSGLSCASGYNVAVDAYDAAGNRSGKSSMSVSTAACSAPSGAGVYVSTGGNDSTCVRGDQSRPCATLNRAFTVASCGDIVSVSDGTYGSQTISTGKSCSPSTPVRFVAASGRPSFAEVTVKTSYVWIEGMRVPHSLSSSSVGFWNVSAPSGQSPSAASYVTLKNDEGGGLFIVGEHVDVLGGSYGGFSACLTGQEDLTRIWQQTDASGTYRASSFVTFDGVTIHDGTDGGNICGGMHVDALQILGGHNITIRNSRFLNCPTSCIIGSGFRTGEDNYLIENNFFQDVEHPGASVNFGYSASGDPPTGANMVIRYNTTNGVISTGCTSGSPGCWSVYGNIAAAASCVSGTWSRNVIFNGSCTGGGGKQCTPTFVGPTPRSSYGSATVPNLHLSAGDTCAKNAGDPTRYPSTDIDGNQRPAGGSPDAGADEVG
jgi:chitodextrinase